MALVDLLLGDDSELALRARTTRVLIRVVASLVASIVALLDPEVIVLGGWIERLPKATLVDIEDAIAQLSPVRSAVAALGPGVHRDDRGSRNQRSSRIHRDDLGDPSEVNVTMPSAVFGLNTCFAVKRWPEPEEWAPSPRVWGWSTRSSPLT